MLLLLLSFSYFCTAKIPLYYLTYYSLIIAKKTSEASFLHSPLGGSRCLIFSRAYLPIVLWVILKKDRTMPIWHHKLRAADREIAHPYGSLEFFVVAQDTAMERQNAYHQMNA